MQPGRLLRDAAAEGLRTRGRRYGSPLFWTAGRHRLAAGMSLVSWFGQAILQTRSLSFFRPHAAPMAKVFVGHSIYKGKAALTVEPRAPEFAPLDVTRAFSEFKLTPIKFLGLFQLWWLPNATWVQSGAYKLSKEGCIFLQFAPAIGTRQYDWNRKQVTRNISRALEVFIYFFC